MPDPTPALTITTVAEGLICAGEIDAHTAPDLDRALSDIVTSGQAARLDMAAITFIDSSGIRTLISSTNASRQHGGDLVIAPSPMVTRVMEMSGLDKFFTVAETG